MSQAQNIGKKRKKNGYTQISNSLFEDSNLSWKAKGILCYLLSRPDNWKINKSDLQNRATEGRESLQNGLNELKDQGYLHIYRNIGEDGQFKGWIWEYDDVSFKTEERENRTTGNQQENGENVLVTRTTENPYDGKPVRRKTRIYNNKDFNNKDFNNTKDKKEKKIYNKNNRSISSEIDREFEQLWKLYPRKLGKKKAFDAYKKTRKVKKIAYKTVENGLYRYLKYLETQGTEEQFIMHGSTWFFQEKWQDEYITTGIKKKPKDALEYFRMKNGGDNYEPYGNSEVIDYYPETIPEPF